MFYSLLLQKDNEFFIGTVKRVAGGYLAQKQMTWPVKQERGSGNIACLYRLMFKGH